MAWINPSPTSLLLGTLTDLTRSKAELLAENALLRHQLIILRRQIKRPIYRKTDLVLLVSNQDGPDLETGAFPRPAGDTPRGPRELFRWFTEAQIKETFEEAEALARDDQLDQGDGSEQSTVGSGAYTG